MPIFERVMHFPHSEEEMFDFFCRPANLIKLSPPDLHLQLVDGPERIELGSRITFKGRRLGVPQTFVSEIKAFVPNVMFMDVMLKGPFRKWEHTHGFLAADGGTSVADRIDYEPPGGLLGLVATPSLVARDLEKIFTYRVKRLEEIMGGRKG
jgi:ligand-binding SRPBCC domain-containing protein